MNNSNLSTGPRIIIVALIGIMSLFSLYSADNEFDFNAELDDPSTDEFLSDTKFDIECKVNDPQNIVQLLLNFKAPCLLQDNIYLKTYPLNKKSIIDIPAFFQCKKYEQKRIFGISPFFYQTWRMFFTEQCDGIQSYLAICDPTLLARLRDCAACVGWEDKIDPLAVFPLFANLTIQDRQMGLMFHGDKHCGSTHVHVHVPVMYLERNYYMTSAEQTNIENSFARISAACGNDTCGQPCQEDMNKKTEFALQHLVSDKVGIGDTRLHVDVDYFKGPSYAFGFGFVATIPTAFAFQKGLLGASFENSGVPCDFCIGKVIELVDDGKTAEASAMGQQFMLGALDRMSANFLDTGLGYDKHVGLGASFYSKSRLSFFFRRPWAQSIKLRSRLILQYYFPATEQRLFTENKNAEDYEFDIDKVVDSQKYAQDTLDFLNIKFIEQLYPFKLATVVHPGFIFQWTSNWYYETGRWKVEMISDTWIKSNETFGTICIPRGTPNLNFDCAKRPMAYQSRLGGSLAYTLNYPTKSYTFGLYVDGAYWTYGIGKDFTAALNFECNF